MHEELHQKIVFILADTSVRVADQRSVGETNESSNEMDLNFDSLLLFGFHLYFRFLIIKYEKLQRSYLFFQLVSRRNSTNPAI